VGGTCNTNERDDKCIQNVGRKTCSEKNYSKVLCVCGKITLEWILGKLGRKAWTGFICLRIVTSGGLL